MVVKRRGWGCGVALIDSRWSIWEGRQQRVHAADHRLAYAFACLDIIGSVVSEGAVNIGA